MHRGPGGPWPGFGARSLNGDQLWDWFPNLNTVSWVCPFPGSTVRVTQESVCIVLPQISASSQLSTTGIWVSVDVLMWEQMFLSGCTLPHSKPRVTTVHTHNQEQASLLCKGTDTKSFRLHGSCGLCHSYSLLLLWPHIPGQQARWPGSHKPVLTSEGHQQIWLKIHGFYQLRMLGHTLSVMQTVSWLLLWEQWLPDVQHNDLQSHPHRFHFYHEAQRQYLINSGR